MAMNRDDLLNITTHVPVPGALRQIDDRMSRALRGLSDAGIMSDSVERTVVYFKKLGLTETQIRKAMTRACFEELKRGTER